jgi:uncharacterized membrane protein YheB (UPF0754 family)
MPEDNFVFMNYWLILIPVISAFIGWFTNWIAIKMLFHPREPKKIFGITFQGIFPKRQKTLAANLGKLVSDEFLSFTDIEEKISNPQNLKQVMPVIDAHIENFLRRKLPDEMPVISMFIGDKTINRMKAVFIRELEELFPALMKQFTGNMKNELDLEHIVYTKVSAFSSDKLEEILYQIMSKEFRFVEILGGIIGFLIGLLQIFISEFTR